MSKHLEFLSFDVLSVQAVDAEDGEVGFLNGKVEIESTNSQLGTVSRMALKVRIPRDDQEPFAQIQEKLFAEARDTVVLAAETLKGASLSDINAMSTEALERYDRLEEERRAKRIKSDR